MSCREPENSETFLWLWLIDIFARYLKPPRQIAGCADRTSKYETKGGNAAMERFLSEDDHLKKALVVGKDNEKQKETAKSSCLENDHLWTELNNSDGGQH